MDSISICPRANPVIISSESKKKKLRKYELGRIIVQKQPQQQQHKNAIEETITKGVPDNRLKATESVSIL